MPFEHLERTGRRGWASGLDMSRLNLRFLFKKTFHGNSVRVETTSTPAQKKGLRKPMVDAKEQPLL